MQKIFVYSFLLLFVTKIEVNIPLNEVIKKEKAGIFRRPNKFLLLILQN